MTKTSSPSLSGTPSFTRSGARPCVRRLSMMRETFPTAGPYQYREPSAQAPIDLFKLFAIVRRQWRIAAWSVGVMLLLGVLYLLAAPPKYTAMTTILIDQDNCRILYQGSAL